MAKVTVEEPKSVVEEVTKYECDQCKKRVAEDSINRQRIYHSSDSRKTEDIRESSHLCDECVEYERYQTLTEMHDRKECFASMATTGINFGLMTMVALVSGIAGVALGTAYSLIRFSAETVVETSLLSGGDWFAVLTLGAIFFIVYGLILVFVGDALEQTFEQT